MAWGNNSQGQTAIASNGTDAAAGNDDSLLIVWAFRNYYGAVAGSPPTTFLSPVSGDPRNIATTGNALNRGMNR